MFTVQPVFWDFISFQNVQFLDVPAFFLIRQIINSVKVNTIWAVFTMLVFWGNGRFQSLFIQINLSIWMKCRCHFYKSIKALSFNWLIEVTPIFHRSYDYISQVTTETIYCFCTRVYRYPKQPSHSWRCGARSAQGKQPQSLASINYGNIGTGVPLSNPQR